MNKTMIGAALVLSAACSPQTLGHYPNTEPAPHLTPRERCVQMDADYALHAADLCDTLATADGITAQEWAGYNEDNGWRLTWYNDSGDGCWDTHRTTARHITICWDGRIWKA